MKSLLIVILVSSGLLMAPACKNSKDSKAGEENVIKVAGVPAVVQSSFSAKYSGATGVTWEDAHEGTEESYKVKFKKDGKEWKAEFKPDGSLIKEKQDD